MLTELGTQSWARSAEPDWWRRYVGGIMGTEGLCDGPCNP